MAGSSVRITVACPQCGEHFETWHRSSIDPDPDFVGEGDVHDLTMAACPTCGEVVALDTLVVEDDGGTMSSAL